MFHTSVLYLISAVYIAYNHGLVLFCISTIIYSFGTLIKTLIDQNSKLATNDYISNVKNTFRTKDHRILYTISSVFIPRKSLYSISKRNYSSFCLNSVPKTFTLVSFSPRITITKHEMHRSGHTLAKTTYHLLDNLLDHRILNTMSKTDKTLLLNTLFEYSLNPNDGILQHKATLLHQMFRDKYPSNLFKDLYLKRFPTSKVDFVKDILTDFRIFAELPVIRKYEETFREDIKQVLLTGDSITTTFEKQKQANPDMIVHLSSPKGIKTIYQDVKSGTVKHTTRGSLDIVTYDSNKQPIPFTSQDLDLLEKNKKNINGIRQGILHDNISETSFEGVLQQAESLLEIKSNIFKIHDQVQQLLWKEVQCHPSYNRSVAFTFVEHQDPTIMTDRFIAYKSKFIQLWGNREYNPNKIGDRKDMFKVMLRSYREIDRDTRIKIERIGENSHFDHHFLEVLSQLIKQTLI